MDKNRVRRHFKEPIGEEMTRTWVVRECFLEEVAFKVAKPARKEGIHLEDEESAGTESFRQRELHSPSTENGKTRENLVRGKQCPPDEGGEYWWVGCAPLKSLALSILRAMGLHKLVF